MRRKGYVTIMSAFYYNTLEEKHSVFKYQDTKTITTETEFKSFFEDDLARKSNFGKSPIFRGVGEAKWKIISSCQRAFLSGKVFDSTQSQFIDREITYLKEVLNGLLPKYYDELGIPVTDFIYLSFLQHYGAATTLIDFTRNHNTALWMATNNIQYPIISEKDIDQYFSIYWIDKDGQENLPSILNIYRNSYLRYITDIVEKHGENDTKDNIGLNSKYSHTLEGKRFFSANAFEFLKWDNGGTGACLAKIGLGLIYTKNMSKHNRRYSLEQVEEEMQTTATKLSERFSKRAIDAFKNIVSYLFNEVVRIANLNLVAQEGCFIHYLPKSYKTPLEEDNTMKGIIHCVDIHKSLVPFILNTLNQDGVNQKTMYPDTRDMAQSAFQSAQSLRL